jgi:hypothetical protein
MECAWEKYQLNFLWGGGFLLKFSFILRLCLLLWKINMGIYGILCGSIFFLWGGTKSTRYCDHFWPILQAPDDRWGWLWSNWWNEDWQGKPKYSEKTCPSATLSPTNPPWPDPGSNPGRRGGKPATNRLSYGAAAEVSYWKSPTPWWNQLLLRILSWCSYSWLIHKFIAVITSIRRMTPDRANSIWFTCSEPVFLTRKFSNILIKY